MDNGMREGKRRSEGFWRRREIGEVDKRSKERVSGRELLMVNVCDIVEKRKKWRRQEN